MQYSHRIQSGNEFSVGLAKIVSQPTTTLNKITSYQSLEKGVLQNSTTTNGPIPHIRFGKRTLREAVNCQVSSQAYQTIPQLQDSVEITELKLQKLFSSTPFGKGRKERKHHGKE